MTETIAAYRLNDFCASHGISRAQVYVEIREGRLKARKLGTKTLILAADAQAYLDSLPAFQPSKAA